MVNFYIENLVFVLWYIFTFFKKTARLFSKVVVPSDIPTSHIHTNTDSVSLFNINWVCSGISLWFILCVYVKTSLTGEESSLYFPPLFHYIDLVWLSRAGKKCWLSEYISEEGEEIYLLFPPLLFQDTTRCFWSL